MSNDNLDNSTYINNVHTLLRMNNPHMDNQKQSEAEQYLGSNTEILELIQHSVSQRTKPQTLTHSLKSCMPQCDDTIRFSSFFIIQRKISGKANKIIETNL